MLIGWISFGVKFNKKGCHCIQDYIVQNFTIEGYNNRAYIIFGTCVPKMTTDQRSDANVLKGLITHLIDVNMQRLDRKNETRTVVETFHFSRSTKNRRGIAIAICIFD